MALDHFISLLVWCLEILKMQSMIQWKLENQYMFKVSQADDNKLKPSNGNIAFPFCLNITFRYVLILIGSWR